ncbi:hypothetical protein ACKWRH_08290 [Bradyrhizobium sp. Pa8]|uniref:hypothetical protein n=1 Tax=Bradyrhizobium sp. Pa8 TaxID=3386552 RepID=UPI00403F5561
MGKFANDQYCGVAELCARIQAAECNLPSFSRHQPNELWWITRNSPERHFERAPEAARRSDRPKGSGEGADMRGSFAEKILRKNSKKLLA